MDGNKFIKTLLVTSFVLGASSVNASAQDNIDELMDMPLKDLMKMEVTSVSKKAEKATDAAAAIYVITQEDIKRSGITSVPEALRMAPGIQVSRISASQWAITSRGFAEDFAKKLLVLIDGRSIYNPLFSGVLWEEQGVPLEDIERIEVIRGPGSTLWGANAVNGVINIITKSSKDTQGTMITSGVGSYENFAGVARHGGKIGEDTTYRAYIQNYNHGSSENLDGTDKFDDWNISRSGFRSDGKLSETATFTVQGDVYKGRRNEAFDRLPSLTGPFLDPALGLYTIAPDDHNMSGGNILGRYNRKLENNSDLTLQMYFDYTDREFNIFSQKIDTIDLDAQHSFNLSENHNILWGLGFRRIGYDLGTSLVTRYEANERDQATSLWSGFVQDKIQLVPDELFLTLGSKIEHNDYTGVEIQPNARLTWLATDNQTVWGSITRAVRTPSQIERDLTQVVAANPLLGPGFIAITDDDKLESEELLAYEVGYRVQPTEKTSLDFAAFINQYNNLRTFEQNGPISVDIPVSYVTRNYSKATTSGLEVSANWEVSDRWSLTGSYSYLDMDIKLDSKSTDNLIGETEEGRSPSNMFNIRSHYRFDSEWQMNNNVYYVGDINTYNIDSYVRFDTNVIWEPTEGLELSLAGYNLLDNAHQEYSGVTFNTPSQIPRSVFGKVTFRF